MYRDEPICIKCLHKHPTALTCVQAKEAQGASRPQTVKVCEGYCDACEADHSGFTCHDFQTMKAKALREQAARESQGDARLTHLNPTSRANPCQHCGSMIPSAHHICHGSTEKAAAPQDGSKVAGYRKLSDAEIAQMNAFKAAGRNLVDEIDTLIQQLRDKTTGAAMRSAAQAAEDQTAMRWLHVARTHTQQAVMAACRAVARPADDC